MQRFLLYVKSSAVGREKIAFLTQGHMLTIEDNKLRLKGL